MKKVFLLICVAVMGVMQAMAQNGLNDKADNIVGTYVAKQGEDNFKAKITKLADGTYQGQVIWLEHDRDAQGKKLLDDKNPDKSLRSTPADQIVLFSGLKYNAKEHRWDGCKIYDPQRGIKANLKVDFDDKGQLRLRGSIMGIGETVYWNKEK